jgi:outer membrane cobalamin receptor
MLSILVPSLNLLAQQPAPSDQLPAELEPLRTSITVTERVSAEAPAALSVVNRLDLNQTPGVNLDDRLRQVPGFTLFRRSSSVAANPTTQGVSLRGIGPSGASRTLVLWDGVPMNDPFGGWVYWTRFPPEQVERVEISRGASTSLFGDRAMGGAIAIFSREPEPRTVRLAYEGGNRNTHELSAGASHVFRRIGISGHVRAFTTEGYFIVPERIRGSIDTPASVDFVAGNLRFDLLGSTHRLFTKLDILVEDRANGTVLQRNSTSLGTLSANYSWQGSSDGITVIGYHTREEYRATFSAIGANRQSERLTARQVVPSEAVGGAAYWRHNGSRYNLLAGADVERVEGFSTDFLVPSGIRVGGGTRTQHGTFAQFDAGTTSARIFLGARHHFTGGDDRFFSPSAGFAFGRGRMRFRGSGYRSFRAPTLNELHREFRVGNAVTLPNEDLQPESVAGGEIGVDMGGEATRLSVTAFRNSVDRIITNVTLSTGPTIMRQRQNAASALAQGLEATLRGRWHSWFGELAYLFVDSRFESGPRIPQVPKHQGAALLTYSRRGTLASVGMRTSSFQFEDDINRFVLAGYATVQLALRQRLTRNLSATLAFENLLDRQFYVGFSPTPNIGPPRLWRAGLRWDGRLW